MDDPAPQQRGDVRTGAEELEDVLSDPELHYRFLVEESGDMLSVHDMTGELRWLSPAVERILGWTPEERLSTDTSLVLPEDQPLVDEVLEALKAGGESRTARVRMRHKNGELRWVDTSARAWRAPSGVVGGMVVVTRDVHDLVVAAQERMDLEQRYRLIAENAGDLVLEAVGSTLRWVSPSSQAVLGWTPDELIGRKVWEFIHQDDIAAVQAAADLVDAGHSVSGRVRVLCSDLTYRWYARTTRPITEDGVVAQVTSLRDIGEQVLAEQALMESEERYRALADVSTDYAMRARVDGLIEWISPSVRRVTGWSPHELVGTESFTYIHPDDVERVKTALMDLMPGETVTGRVRVRCHDGSYRWMSDRARGVYDADGVLLGRITGFTDVDDQVRAEEASAASERRFRLAMASAPIGIAVVDLDRRFLEVNPSLCRLLGRDEDWLRTHRVPDVVDPADDALDLQMRAEVLSGRTESVIEEKRMRRSDGSLVWVQHAIGILRDSEGTPTGYVSQFVDITETRQARQDLHELATHDPLTHLVNRAELLNRMGRIQSHPVRSGTRLAVLFADLDGLKAINDTHGHAAGDAVLVEVAERIMRSVRSDDVVARLGGDEYVVALPNVHTLEDAAAIAEKIHSAVDTPFEHRGTSIEVSLSIGIALASPGADPEEVLDRADQALYAAKRRGGGRTETHRSPDPAPRHADPSS